MSLEPQRKLKPFTGDLRQTIIDACAEVGGGSLEGYLDKIVREHPGTGLAQQARYYKRLLAQDADPKVASKVAEIKRRLAAKYPNIQPHASKEGQNHVD